MTIAATGRTIMLLDDDAFDQMLHERLLGKCGYDGKIISFSYPDEALEYLRNPANDPVDMIWLDVNMPRLTGFEFLDKAVEDLGESFVKVVVIMLTTSLLQADVDRARRHSFIRELVKKPIDEAGVRDLLSELASC